jgi:hypothetical protein
MPLTEEGRAEMARMEAERLARYAEEAAEPSGLHTRGQGVRFLEIVVRLPHVILAAAVAEEAGKAAGSTKLRGLGLPLPFTEENGQVGIVRLWVRWEKQRGGKAKLTGFDVRKGKDRTGERILQLHIRSHDGALYGFPTGSSRTIEELARRLLEAEAAGQSTDPLGAMARHVVTQASCAFCCCCGRLLTDPVSVQTGIGPECGEFFHKVFLGRWRIERRAWTS